MPKLDAKVSEKFPLPSLTVSPMAELFTFRCRTELTKKSFIPLSDPLAALQLVTAMKAS
jgi:hypothetical protein